MSPALDPAQNNPFPGLRPFREDEEYLFFGRERQVDAMVDKLAATRFLAVVGTSGSGKSSLVNCGLRPALRGGLMTRAGTAWRMAQFRPGSDPLGAMARALAEDGVLFHDYQTGGLSLAEIVDTTLRMSKLGLIDIYEQARLDKDVNLLVVVDQFEELFRYRQLGIGQDKKLSGISEAATAFVNLLLAAKEHTTYPIYVVLTMRSDFLGDCTQFPGLAEAINAGQYLVPRMTRDERRAAISGPVGVGGAEIAPVLLTRLVNDVGDNPDQLSILQHALNRTWAHWQNQGGGTGPLALTHYEAIGTMAHALDQHAERACAELGTPRQQQICEKLFKALTDKATDPRGIRRPTTLGTLCALADATPAEVTAVIDVFRKPSRSFLMPPAGEVLETETVIDISHESLMRVWQRLNRWADEEARSAQTYRRLAETAALHAAGQASLWRDPDLQVALDWRDQSQPNETWARRYHPGFPAATDFLTQSREAREAERAERAEQRRRELEAEQEKAEAQARHARRMRWAALFSGALAVTAICIGLWALQAEGEASKARDEAITQKKIALEAKAKLQKQYLQLMAGMSISDVLDKSGVPGEIKIDKTEPAWASLMEQNGRTFVTTREYESGRILAVGHEGVLTKPDETFLKRAFEWLTGEGAPLILTSIGHCEWYPTRPFEPEDKTKLPNLLKKWEYKARAVPGVIDDAKLTGGGVLVIGNAWGNLTDTEIKAIEKFVSHGGGLFVAGLGWAWKDYGAKDDFRCEGQVKGQDVGDLSTYPMNRVVEPYGMQWTKEVIEVKSPALPGGAF